MSKGNCCGKKIDTGLNPQSKNLWAHLCKRVAHRIDSDVSLNAESAGEKIGGPLPESGHIASGPREAAYKKHDDSEGCQKYQSDFAVADETTNGDGEEDGCKKERQNESCKSCYIGCLRQMKAVGDKYQSVNR